MWDRLLISQLDARLKSTPFRCSPCLLFQGALPLRPPHHRQCTIPAGAPARTWLLWRGVGNVTGYRPAVSPRRSPSGGPHQHLHALWYPQPLIAIPLCLTSYVCPVCFIPCRSFQNIPFSHRLLNFSGCFSLIRWKRWAMEASCRRERKSKCYLEVINELPHHYKLRVVVLDLIGVQ